MTHYKAWYIKLTSLWISCLYYKKGLSAPWRFEGKAEMRWERGRRGGRGRNTAGAEKERERDAVYCCISTRLRDTNHVSLAPRPITNTHIDSLRRRGVENTGRDAAAVNSRKAYTLIYTNKAASSHGWEVKIHQQPWITDFDTNAWCAQGSAWVRQITCRSKNLLYLL